jgi:4-hydroxy-3-methylbut-2-enyl diphosphate reductase
VSGLLVLAPLRLEGTALRRAGRVLVAGMGSERAAVAAARALAIPARTVAVAGVCGGVAAELRAGDVVCATELRAGSVRRVVESGEQLAASLRSRGVRAVAGPIASVARVLDPAERRALAADGVLAVDTESAWLADGANGRPLAVVRAVADADGRRLADPRMLVEGPRALLALRRSSAALAQWAAEAGG